MRSKTAVCLAITFLLMVQFVSVPSQSVLEDDLTVFFADTEPEILAHAGSSSGHVNSSFMEAVPGGWIISGDTRNDLQFGPHNLQATSPNNAGNDADSYIAFLNEAGTWQWAVKPDASQGLVFLQAMTVSIVGDIYVGGLIWGQVTFGSITLSEFNSQGDAFVAKLDPQGNWMWATSFRTDNNSGRTFVNGLTTTMTGELIVSGHQNGDSQIGNVIVNTTDTEYMLVSMDSMTGGVNWAEVAGGLGTDIAYDVGTDSMGNIWQVGVTSGTFTAGGKSHQAISQQDTVLVKWSSNGAQVLDVKGIASSATHLSIPDDLIVDSNDDILISGVFLGTLDAGNQKTVTDQGNGDAFVVKIANSGTADWITSAGSSSNLDWASSISEDPNGDYAVGGVFSGTSSFGSNYISSNGNQDAFVAQLDNSGNWKWVENLGGASDDLLGAVAVNMTGNYSATGSFQTSITKGTQSITSSTGLDLFVWVFDPSNNADRDNDGVNDLTDNCPDTNNPLQYDSDLDDEGDECDYDDDNDGITDNSGDDCPRGGAWNWTSNSTTDFDNDGCKDNSEDLDDDNDGVADVDDDCDNSSYTPPRDWWISNAQNDIDGDGCRDADEDGDDDGDGTDDVSDDCSSSYGTSTLGTYIGCPDADDDGWADVEDTCPSAAGNSTFGQALGCPDSDGDGWRDTADAMPNNPSQWHDADSDGYGDNQEGNTPDACISTSGSSIIDRYGCPDPDGDGISSADSFWTIEDGADAFPTDETQWSDWDEDGFGDNWGNESWNNRNEIWPGMYYAFARDQDACPTLSGGSWQEGILGCQDSDGDGWADFMDAFPADSEEYQDSDGDGFADGKDACPEINGNSTEDREGCPDSDGDGWSDPEVPNYMPIDGADAFPLNPEKWVDTDGDFYADNFDDCPNDAGYSTLGNMIGCPDSDNDGWADLIDVFPNDGFEHSDMDGDGVGDNADAFPNDASESKDSDGDGVGDIEQFAAEQKAEEDAFQTMMYGLAGGLFLLVLVIVIVLKMRGGREDEIKVWSVTPAMPDMSAQVAQPTYVQPAMPDMSAQVAQPVYSQPVMPVADPALAGRDIYQQQMPVLAPAAVAPAAPTVNDVGTMRSDGNEWLEYPEASGAWYMRDAATRQWIRKI